MLLPALSRLVGVISRYGVYRGTPSPSLPTFICYTRQMVLVSEASTKFLYSHNLLRFRAKCTVSCSMRGRWKVGSPAADDF
jgi:hypothetical protein